MRGKIAKKIRRIVYRYDLSTRVKEYIDGREPNSGGTCICKGNRRVHQLTKTLYLASRRG